MSRVEHHASPASQGPLLLAFVDALAIAAFVLAGIHAHQEGSTAELFARNAVPLLVCWFGAALVFHTYRNPGASTLLRTWAASTPIALLVRTALVGSPTGGRLVVLLAVAMTFTLLFLLIGRASATFVARMIDARSAT
jgi:hypothetical protein